MKYYMEKSEIFNWVSIVYLAVISEYITHNYTHILIIWSLIVLVIGNAKRVYNPKYEYVLCYIRRLLYVAPFFLSVLFLEYNVFKLNNYFFLIFSVAIGVGLLLPKFKEWILILDCNFLRLNHKARYDYLSNILMMLGVPVAEEVFFRAFIMAQSDNIVLGIITSAFLFVLNHFGTKWGGKFHIYDLCVQIIFSIMSCLLFIYSSSIIPSIVAHALYNGPMLICDIRGYILVEDE